MSHIDPRSNDTPREYPAQGVTLPRGATEDALRAVEIAGEAAFDLAEEGLADFEPFRPLVRVARLLRAALAPAPVPA